MKKTLLASLFIVLLAGGISAQETSVKRFNIDNSTYKKFSIGTDFTYDFWMDMPESMGDWRFNRSSSFFGTYNFRIKNSSFYFCPGLGFNFRNLYSSALLQQDSVFGVAYNRISKDVDYKKSKTTFSYIELPLEIRYSYHRFQVGLGLKISCNIGISAKYKGDKFTTDDIIGAETGDMVKEKWKNVPKAETWQFGGQLRIGYSWIHLYGYYSFTHAFKSSTGIEMYPISLGVTIMPFK